MRLNTQGLRAGRLSICLACVLFLIVSCVPVTVTPAAPAPAAPEPTAVPPAEAPTATELPPTESPTETAIPATEEPTAEPAEEATEEPVQEATEEPAEEATEELAEEAATPDTSSETAIVPAEMTMDVCLSCHSPFEDVQAATEGSFTTAMDENINPHVFVPHDSENLPECNNCHEPHPVPFTTAEDVPEAGVDWCYAQCHHVGNFLPCIACHAG